MSLENILVCNAWNHPPGCTCGFGGEGHLGGGRGWNGGGAATIKTYPFHSSMRDLCREYGYSLVVPTNCRHCGRLIYLYANQDGGFAIFDQLGKPWPKHLCALIRSTTREYYSLNTIFSSNHRFPIPDRTEEGELREGQTIRGSVTAIENGRAEVFDGKHRYWVTASSLVRLGQAVEGTVRSSNGRPVIQLVTLPPPDREELAASEQAATSKEGEVMDVADHNDSVRRLGRWFKMRKKISWSVISNTNQIVALYDFPKQAEAEAYAKQLTDERQEPFRVAQFLQYIE